MTGLLDGQTGATRTAHSFCRICANYCGVELTIDRDDRILSVRGDTQHADTRGYVCVKGTASGEMHGREDRILQPLKRRDDGTFAPISLELALDEIADGVRRLVAEFGPHTVSAFLGTTGYFNVTASQMLISWLDALGSRSFFSSFTIDCSSKAVTAGRLGTWAAGKPTFVSSEVWLCFGNNPLVSMSGQAGVALGHPAKAMKEALAQGMQLIVVDPRETETARHATLFLQPRPGEDPAIVAGITRILFDEGLIDQDFCDRHVLGLDRLGEAVDPFTPDYVAKRAGIDAGLLREAALLWGGAGKRGCAGMATGLTMSPHSNLVDHLIETLNVICGRYLRAGEALPNSGPILPRPAAFAEVRPPTRPWETGGYTSRVGDFGLIPGINPRGEIPSAILPEEILSPGDGQIRCLFVEGGNPSVAIPDQHRVVEALSSLDLLVTVEPFMTPTARLAHYILPPKLMYERSDIPMVFGYQWRMSHPFYQYSAPAVASPEGSELIEDWQLYWELAKRLGQTLDFCGVQLDPEHQPTNDELIALLLRDGQVPFEELARHPHGKVFDDVDPVIVQETRPDATGRFDVMPDDVYAELQDFITKPQPEGATHLLTNRRMRRSMNGGEPGTPSPKYNPAYLNPDDLAALGLEVGDQVEIVSDHSRIIGIVEPDERLRSGVVSMSHCHGGLPGEDEDPDAGANTGRLVDARRHRQAINAMPTMSGVPVRIIPWSQPYGERSGSRS